MMISFQRALGVFQESHKRCGSAGSSSQAWKTAWTLRLSHRGTRKIVSEQISTLRPQPWAERTLCWDRGWALARTCLLTWQVSFPLWASVFPICEMGTAMLLPTTLPPWQVLSFLILFQNCPWDISVLKAWDQHFSETLSKRAAGPVSETPGPVSTIQALRRLSVIKCLQPEKKKKRKKKKRKLLQT